MIPEYSDATQLRSQGSKKLYAGLGGIRRFFPVVQVVDEDRSSNEVPRQDYEIHIQTIHHLYRGADGCGRKKRVVVKIAELSDGEAVESLVQPSNRHIDVDNLGVIGLENETVNFEYQTCCASNSGAPLEKSPSRQRCQRSVFLLGGRQRGFWGVTMIIVSNDKLALITGRQNQPLWAFGTACAGIFRRKCRVR